MFSLYFLTFSNIWKHLKHLYNSFRQNKINLYIFSPQRWFIKMVHHAVFYTFAVELELPISLDFGPIHHARRQKIVKRWSSTRHWRVIDNGEDFLAIASALNIKRRSAYSIVITYQRTGRGETLPAGVSWHHLSLMPYWGLTTSKRMNDLV